MNTETRIARCRFARGCLARPGVGSTRKVCDLNQTCAAEPGSKRPKTEVEVASTRGWRPPHT